MPVTPFPHLDRSWVANHPNATAEQHPLIRDHGWGEAQCPPGQEEVMTVAELYRLRETHQGLYRYTPYYTAEDMLRAEAENAWRRPYERLSPRQIMDRFRAAAAPIYGAVHITQHRGWYEARTPQHRFPKMQRWDLMRLAERLVQERQAGAPDQAPQQSLPL